MRSKQVILMSNQIEKGIIVKLEEMLYAENKTNVRYQEGKHNNKYETQQLYYTPTHTHLVGVNSLSVQWAADRHISSLHVNGEETFGILIGTGSRQLKDMVPRLVCWNHLQTHTTINDTFNRKLFLFSSPWFLRQKANHLYFGSHWIPFFISNLIACIWADRTHWAWNSDKDPS